MHTEFSDVSAPYVCQSNPEMTDSWGRRVCNSVLYVRVTGSVLTSVSVGDRSIRTQLSSAGWRVRIFHLLEERRQSKIVFLCSKVLIRQCMWRFSVSNCRAVYKPVHLQCIGLLSQRARNWSLSIITFNGRSEKNYFSGERWSLAVVLFRLQCTDYTFEW